MIPICLTIAGSDSSGGAGIQADLKTFAANGCYGTSVITAITVQNTMGVQAVYPVETKVVIEQIEAVLNDMPVAAVKIGMLGNAEIAEAVVGKLSKTTIPVVIDPVFSSTSGATLYRCDCLETDFEKIYPFCTLATPNVSEAAQLNGLTKSPETDRDFLGKSLVARGLDAVLITGGDVSGDVKTDTLFMKNDGSVQIRKFQNPSISTSNSHGTGCTLSSAITAFMAKGESLARAVELGIHYVNSCLRASILFKTGEGKGGLDHFSGCRQ